MMKAGTVLRVARPTDHLTTIAEMYATGLDFTVLAQFEDMTASTASSSDTPTIPTIWSSRPNVDTRLAKRLPKIICWCSICPTRRHGKPVVPGCSQRGFNVSPRIIPIGKPRGRRSRISMGIGSCSRTRRGPCKGSYGKTWHCSRLLPAYA